MVKWINVLSAVFLTGCAMGPESFQGPVPPGNQDTYACAVQQLNVLGYTIQSGDRSTGFVRASKLTSGLGTRILTGNDYHDVLTVALFEDPTTEETLLRVTVGRVATGAIGLSRGGENEVNPSDEGLADGHELLAQCGVEEVSREVGSTHSM